MVVDTYIMPISRHSLIRRTIKFAVVALLSFVLLICWYFWSNAGRSNDRYGVLQAMIKQKISGQSMVSVRGRSDIFLSKADPNKSALKAYMKRLGWGEFDQLGSVMYFKKDRQRMEIKSLSMTRYFEVLTFDREP